PLRLRRRSTLLPYTTLFRSLVQLLHGDRGRHFASDNPVPGLGERVREDIVRQTGRQTLRPQVDDLVGEGLPRLRPELLILQAFEDRKSTRLNSSHVKISYAV